MWNEDFLKPYIGAVVNLVTNILLVKYIGVSGALLSTIIIMIFIYAPWETHVLFKYLFERSAKEYILKMLIYTLVNIGLAYFTNLICGFVTYKGIAGLFFRLLICIILPNVLFTLFFFKTDEFQDAKSKVLGLVKR